MKTKYKIQVVFIVLLIMMLLIAGCTQSQVDYSGSTQTLPSSSPKPSEVVASDIPIGTMTPDAQTEVDRITNNDQDSNTAATLIPTSTYYSIWDSSAVPQIESEDDSSAVELGVKFQSDVFGLISGIRFYKGSANTGTHVGSLWDSAGTLLAQATFTNESASGWQQVNFETPVVISADTVYVASYHTDVGNYAADSNYFANAGVDSAPLHALQDGVSAGNGVYAYGSEITFPSDTFQATNYWVDVIFELPGPDVTPPPTPIQTNLPYIYQDGLGAGWSEWSWDITDNYHNPDPVYKDQYSLSITPAKAWAGWGVWYDDGVDTTPYSYLNIAIQGTIEDEWYGVYLLDQGSNALFPDGYFINPPVNSWEEYQIPLSELGAAYTRIYGIRIMNSESTLGTYYLDEIGFGGTAPTPTPTPIPLPQDIALSVDASQLVNPFSNEILGVALVNWEHSWDKYFPADVPHLADVFKSANVGVIRYAGGLWANWVGWERLPQRAPNTEWQPDPSNYSAQFSDLVNKDLTYSFQYGINEIDNLALFSQQTGAEIMIQVNVSNNDPYMWADLLRYTNVENDYNFKYWELGNELDLEISQGNETGMDAETYQERVQQYAAVLRSVDPNILIVGGVPSAAHDIVGSSWTEGVSDMSRYLTAGAAGGADSLSWHWYQNCNSGGDPETMTVWEWDIKPGEDKILDPYRNWRHMYSRIWSQIGPERVQNEVIPKGSAMTQGVTELNFDACDNGIAPQNSNQLNAVWMADILGRLAYNGVDYVTWYTGYGTQTQGYPMVFSQEDYYPETVYLRPSYYTLFLYANYFGDQLVASESGKEADISIWASTDSDDPNSLKLVITNISNSVINSNIEIAGFTATSGMKFELSNPNPLDMSSKSNSQDHGTTINGVTLDAASITSAVDQIEGIPVSVQQGSLKESFAPYSVTAIILKGNN